MRHVDTPLPTDVVDRLPAVGRLIERNPSVVFAYVFGGVARGRVTPLSDLDIAVFLDEHVSHGEVKANLAAELGTFLASDAVDIVVLNTAPLSLAGRVLADAKVLVDRDPSRRYEYESLTRRMFFDFRYLERAILQRRYGVG